MPISRNTIFLNIQSIILLLSSMLTSQLPAQEEVIYDPVLNQNPLVSEAYQLLAQGDSKQALQAFQTALQENNDDLSALLGQAMIFSELQEHQKAFETYDTIVQTYPRHAFAWNGRGLAAFNMEDFDTALNSFKQATAEQPVNGFFYETLAWTQMCRGEFSHAAISAKTATLMYNRKSENSVYPQLIAYFAYLETGDMKNAQASLKYATVNKPHNRWPEPVIDYLTDKIDAAELISYVTDSSQETEAHTYIGLKLRATQHSHDAKPHLNWVAKHGDSRVFEYTLARALHLQDSVALLAP